MNGSEEVFVKDIFYLLSLAQDSDINGNYYHGLRVALLAERMAQELIPEERDLIFFAGLLHDLGAPSSKGHVIYCPDLKIQILNEEIRNHPYEGAHLLRVFPVPFKGQHRMADYIFQHHEWWKGVGYPRQLREQDISLGARILRASDAFDIYSRKGRDQIIPSSALAILETNGEVDPSVFKILERIVREEDFMHRYRNPLQGFYEYMQKKKLEIEFQDVDRDMLFQFVGHVIDMKIHSGYPGHSETDVHYAFQIARALNLDPDEVKLIKDAAYLHDIGKLAIPREVLEKPAILTEKEWEIVKGHSSITIQLLEMVPSLRQYSFSGYHHERWDGEGYPKGLKAEEIPLGARVISVADALDAMTSRRPYRPTLTFKEALDELEKNAGAQFDPEVVSRTLQIFR